MKYPSLINLHLLILFTIKIKFPFSFINIRCYDLYDKHPSFEPSSTASTRYFQEQALLKLFFDEMLYQKQILEFENFFVYLLASNTDRVYISHAKVLPESLN